MSKKIDYIKFIIKMKKMEEYIFNFNRVYYEKIEKFKIIFFIFKLISGKVLNHLFEPLFDFHTKNQNL